MPLATYVNQIKLPHKYIKSDVSKLYGVSRKFYIIFLLLSHNKTVDFRSHITVKNVMEFYGLSCSVRQRKPVAYYEVLSVLEWMAEEGLLVLLTDLNGVRYNTMIETELSPHAFNPGISYSTVTIEQIESISSFNGFNRESLLIVFLYINSCIFRRPRTQDGNEVLSDPSAHPEAAFPSMELISSTFSMSKPTVVKAVSILCSPTLMERPLLIKRRMRAEQSDNGLVRNPPNIYVLNQTGWQTEMKYALENFTYKPESD